MRSYGPIWCTSCTRARWRFRGSALARGGSIVNLTTIEAHRAAPAFAVYSAAKAGLAHLTRSLAVELAPDRIRVNNVAPDLYSDRAGRRATRRGSGRGPARDGGRDGTGTPPRSRSSGPRQPGRFWPRSNSSRPTSGSWSPTTAYKESGITVH
ncbi:SDR family oxidoreductase [Parafrankia sp. FMc2]|uniref:SDR family oxidoreductase n=1 Tax=Parafrankia sp. FMc2 TaxID=3233196 RepID=UPI0034D53329